MLLIVAPGWSAAGDGCDRFGGGWKPHRYIMQCNVARGMEFHEPRHLRGRKRDISSLNMVSQEVEEIADSQTAVTPPKNDANRSI